jgi:hypothetical protein
MNQPTALPIWVGAPRPAAPALLRLKPAAHLESSGEVDANLVKDLANLSHR